MKKKMNPKARSRKGGAFSGIRAATPSRHTHEIPLEDGAYIAVRYDFHEGEVVSFAVVLVAWIGGKAKCVARYDDAHDMPHIDIMGQNGHLREKIWLSTVTRAEALANGVLDFKENWQEYVQRYREG